MASPKSASFSESVRILFIRAKLLGYVFVFLLVGLSHEYGIAQEANIIPQNQSKENKVADRSSESKFSTRAELVLVPVTVTDAIGRLVIGLGAEDFHVFEGKEKQTIKHFSSEDSPVSIGIIFDTSGSMSNKIEYAREAVNEFLKMANPQDEIFLITFSAKPEVVVDFTTSIESNQRGINYPAQKRTTALTKEN